MRIAFMAPEPTWSMYLVFEAVADRLDHDVDLLQSDTLLPDLRDYDRALVHFRVDFDRPLWNDIKEHTWVNAGGYNYVHVPWERVPNVIARSEFMADHLPCEADVCRAGIDPEVFYPDRDVQYSYGTVANQNKIDGLTGGIGKFRDMILHDGWHGEFKSPEEMAALYNEIGVYCSLTSFEGGGNPVIEAGACGCPVVSTYVGFAPEIEGVEYVPYDPDPGVLETVADRAEPFVEEVHEEWTWEAVLPAWRSALEL